MDFAVVGLDCLLPGASGPAEWLARSRAAEPAVGPVPAGRWPMDPEAVLDPKRGALDAVLTTVGGFVDDVPETGDGLDADLAALDPVHRWTLRVVRRALGSLDRSRADLVLANLSLASTGAVRAAAGPWRRWLADRGADVSWLAGGHDRDLDHGFGPADLARRALGLGGRALALDAACASSLYAVQLACDRLASGRCDVAIAAGVQRADSAYLFLGFSQLRALSPSGVPRPFDERADGLVVGEGAAAVAIKRLADALRDGDAIEAVIRGGGLGNDGRKGNLLAPDADGQRRALSSAFTRARLDPADIGYVECHATGTPLGDRVEARALEALHLGRRDPLVLSSAKALIGHTVTVAGLAGMIRAVGAVRDGILPPLPQCEPIRMIDGTTLAVLDEATPWEGPVRRAGVSAFGFGGTNAHVMVESLSESPATPIPAELSRADERLAVVGIGARIGGARGPDQVAEALLDGRSLLRPAPVEVTRGLVDLPRGAWVEAVHVDPTRFRIPPRELTEILPQQLVLLEVAADALAQVEGLDPHTTASVVGMGIDLHVAEAVIRQVPREEALRDAVSPPLTAGRVQGTLPNFVANRVAAVLDLQGPSFTVSVGDSSGPVAVEQAARLLCTGMAEAAVVGASDFRYLGAVRGSAPVGEGAVALVVRRLVDAERDGQPILAVLDPAVPPEDPLGHRATVGHCGHADGMIAVLADVLRQARERGVALPRASVLPESTVRVAHSGPAVPGATFGGRWGAATVPVPIPRRPGEAPRHVAWTGPARPAMAPLTWSRWVGLDPAPVVPEPIPAPPPTPHPAPPVRSGPLPRRAGVGTALAAEIAGTTGLVQAAARSAAALADAHAAFLAEQQRATAQLGAIADTLERALAGLQRGGVRPPPARGPTTPPRALDRAALEVFAEGPISAVLGPAYADLDAIEPRVRLPMAPLLLVSRVVDVEGERGVLGPSRIVTEYDLDPDADWAWEGKPPLCVVVESGQADLLLCAYLGTDAVTRGQTLYRLLDCDLVFHGDRPACGETLRHDIRIKRFARLGDTLLFYFEYDCVAAGDGRPVLTMRNGCAGFFSPAELAHPHGVDPAPADVPRRDPLAPLLRGAPDHLDDTAVRALAAGRYSEAFGAAFAVADGASLRLPPSRWGLLSRVTALHLSGQPHGLGRVVAEQDLSDDDWFNPVHFKGDPCMPGTLMFDGCVQALEVWLMATGVPAAWPEASFEPIPGLAAKLRCRGQVAPGHRRLVYDVRVKEAALEPEPYAIADVVLIADGIPIVTAEDVGVRVRGERVPLRAPAPRRVSEGHLLEFAVGDPVRAFGPAYARFDRDERTPRIPGPPLATMHEVLDVQGEPGVQSEGRAVTVAFDLDVTSWPFAVDPSGTVPLGVLLEVALQPCGWLTAWQGSALSLGGDVYFRNLGGTLVRHAPLVRGATALRTHATLTGLSRSGGMLLTFFDFAVYDGDRLVAEGDTHFGYFGAAALRAQKGLDLPPEDAARRGAWRAAAEPGILAAHPALPREDWRALDRITVRAPAAGSNGLGYWEAEADVDPAAWFFTAHFLQDPVMPGSLGLDGLVQLAAVALHEATGGRDTPIQLLDAPSTWRYRGEVTRERSRITFALDVTSLDAERGVLQGNGVLYADDKPIYAYEGLGVQLPPTPVPVAEPTRRAPAALLDTYAVAGDQGTGTLRLDPSRFPWLADHCPTLVVPAVPMAFAAEIAAEAATLLRPGKRVVGLPEITAERWLHTGDGPVDLLVVAVAEGDTVAVTLAVHHDNPRFPELSGPRVHVRAIVEVADAWADAPPAPAPLADAAPVDLPVSDYYAGGLTFHGPALQAMVDLGSRGPGGAEATFETRPDAALLPPGSPGFVLDPLLLDTATHPMMSGAPRLWNAALPAGLLAYPTRCEGLRLHGPRPEGAVRCRLDLVRADAEALVFDVRLSSEGGPWATFRWSEAPVPGGPLLGRDPERIATFCKQRRPADVHVGHAAGDRWVVAPADLVEPMPGSLVRLLCPPTEVSQWRRAEDPLRWETGRFAAKEALRSWLAPRLGRDVHPSTLRLATLRPGRLVVTEASSLSLQEQVDHLHPTRVVVDLAWDEDGTATAEVRAP